MRSSSGEQDKSGFKLKTTYYDSDSDRAVNSTKIAHTKTTTRARSESPRYDDSGRQAEQAFNQVLRILQYYILNFLSQYKIKFF